MESLVDLWLDLYNEGKASDKGSVHSYLNIYEEMLSPYRHKAKNVLEIGLFNGHSMLLWERYFKGKVYGIDCDVRPHGGMADLTPMIESKQHNIVIMDACSEAAAHEHFGWKKFDVIIEDAGHALYQQLDLYNIWKHYLADDGVYIIEDVQDIDRDKPAFMGIDIERKVEVIDLRKVKGRYDDVLVVIK